MISAGYRGHAILVIPMVRKGTEHTTDNNRQKLTSSTIEFGQHVYSHRSISVEPLIEQIKDVQDKTHYQLEDLIKLGA